MRIHSQAPFAYLNTATKNASRSRERIPCRHLTSIIIADPNPWVRRELAQTIRPYLGTEIINEARSPAEVLTLVADPHCRVLVIDPCMPTLGQTDGVPLLRRICCLRPDLLVLVLSPQRFSLLRDRALPAQIEHVYAKSVSAAWLCRFISLALLRNAAAG